MGEEADQKALTEVAQRLGLPLDSYGQPDWTQARNMIAWWARCQRYRDHTVGTLLATLGLAAYSLWSSIQPFMTTAIRQWIASWLVS